MPKVHRIAFWHRYGPEIDVNGQPIYTPYVFREEDGDAAEAKRQELQGATRERTYHIVTYFQP